ncbi:MAG: site-2 protease family protein [Pirellulales bacterium]|nr:site-2 protease family protein [Pirellulales bacterium]
MGGSWKIGTVAGIGIFVHWTFAILIAWVLLDGFSRGGNLAAGVSSVIFVIAVFGCIVLHELGHALTARRFGIRTLDITILPIGGLARLERMPEDPKQELLVALAGPAVNLVIAVVLGGLLLVVGLGSSLWSGDFVTMPLLAQLVAVNLALLVFNLIPAFPMDGGRVLRALLATRFNYNQATQIAARVGQALAVGFGFAGLMSGHFMLLFIALFVYLGAQAEAQQVETRFSIRGVPVRTVVIGESRALAPTDTLTHAASELLATSQIDFPVAEGGRVVGLLTRHDLIRALAAGRREDAVANVMRRDLPVVEDDSPLEDTFRRMQELGTSTLPVVHHGQLAGIVTLENIGEFMMLRSALDEAQKDAAAPARAGNGMAQGKS